MSSLEGLPPPRSGAEAGFYPDPLRTGRARWWDGKQWTLRMGPRVTADAPMEKVVPPPKRVCRRCGAEAETYEGSCPTCGRSYTQNTGLIAGLIAAAVVLVLALGGCGFLLVAVLDEVDELEHSSSITREEFDSVRIGERRGAVQGRLGDPADTKSFASKLGPSTCISYYESGEGLFQDDRFRICFARGSVYAKSDDG